MTSLQQPSSVEKCNSLLALSQSVQQGILNISPDSFSDGGQYCSLDAALQQALKLVEQGARVIDVGAVSTRPGALDVTDDEELSRVLPILTVLREKLPHSVLLSLDTSSPAVALAAAEARLIDIINDVFASRKTHPDAPSLPKHDRPQLLTTADIAAHFKLGLILMHMQGTPASMQSHPTYDNCLEDVVSFLAERLTFARQRGVQWVAIDPGIGFGKTLDHNLELLTKNAIQRFKTLGAPLLVGLSRKSFLRKLAERDKTLPHFSSASEEMDWRDAQSEIWEKNCILWGANIIRTHKIKTLR